ncbi:MAG: DEAD/DEAH box helicase family protein [Candidatus Omnitrophota bacterium]|nr:DEAD/DEAH box helicase family protein [Candidatus Omnitrophota bacterium]
MNEAQTRKEYIDKALAKAQWSKTGSSIYREEFEMERVWRKSDPVAEREEHYVTEHEYADYLLMGRNDQPLAIIEAKRTTKNARAGQQQAAGYADNIKAKFGVDPFIFLTNGEDIMFWDRQRYPSRLVYGFFERRDLERLYFQRQEAAKNLLDIRINPDIADRDYQAEAIRTVLTGVQNGRRKFLLVMATGTGKTRTSMAIIDALLRAKRINTVLFLTDRKVLRDQAYGKKGFQGFFTESCGKITSGKFNAEKRLYAATIQTMMECYKDISPGFFDLVIADECHRSIYNKWKDVLSYFDSIQIGLTATPAQFIERDTFRYFDVALNTDPKENLFNYTYDKAVEEKHLLLFIPYHAKTSFQIKGLREDEIPPAVKKKLVEEGKTLDELNFEGTEFEKRFTNTGTHEAMVREFMEVCYKDDTGTLPGKTIIFAMTKNHAYRLLDAFDRLYPQYKGRLAEVIVSEDSRADNFLGRFENESFPRIAISVDMLDTGVDIREVVNLVFAKPVFSKIKFWQMIGRGTRTLDKNNMKPWCPQKENFLIIDHWNNFEYFGQKPEGEAPDIQDAITSRVFKAKINRLRVYLSRSDQKEIEGIKKELQDMIALLPKDSISVREKKDVLHRLDSPEFWKNMDTDYLYDQAAPLMRFLEDVNYNEYSFILRCEQLELAVLNKDDRTILDLKTAIKEDLQLLPMTLQVVKRQEQAVFKVSSDAFWDGLNVGNIREARKKLSPIMKYRRADQREIIQFDLDDQVIERKWIEFGPNGEGEYVHIYKEKVEQRIKELAEKERAIVKIRNDEPVNDQDLEDLENTLNGPELYITEDKLREAYNQPQGTLVQFIKSIFGKYKFKSQEDQIAESFDAFIIAHNYNTDQTRFLRVIKSVFLSKVRRHELLELDDFYEGPVEAFGVDAASRLFSQDDLKEVLEFLNERATYRTK